MKQKGIGLTHLVVGIAILVLIISIAYYLGTKKSLRDQVDDQNPVVIPSNETANWKAYNLENIKISVKLPPSWFSHSETKTLYGYTTHFSYPIDNESTQNWKPKQQAQITIGVSPSNGKSLDSLAQERVNGPYSSLVKESQKAQVGGEEGIVLSDKGNHYKQILVNHLGSTYLITLGTPNFTDESNSEYMNVLLEKIDPVFNRIISTVKFN